jgi:hypothetical protein
MLRDVILSDVMPTDAMVTDNMLSDAMRIILIVSDAVFSNVMLTVGLSECST